ncbi:hypothetical protein C8J57DRAFT_1483655, partial [Mycena rebaudengoi]
MWSVKRKGKSQTTASYSSSCRRSHCAILPGEALSRFGGVARCRVFAPVDHPHRRLARGHGDSRSASDARHGLYHATLDLIRNNRAIPLSETDLEVHRSYLSCDYGSASTKSAILEDLSGRAQSESETLEVHAHIANDLLLLLEVPGTEDLWISRNIWRLLNTLVHRGASTAAACGSLVALL